MRLINEKGEQIGIVSLEEALKSAEEAELDLVEVAPNADPTVCKIIDHKKILYQQKRKAREGKKKQKHIELKEIKMRPSIALHDYEFKVRHARDFIEHGDKVRFTVVFRGRAIVHIDLGYDLLNKVIEEMSDIAEVEIGPLQRGSLWD